MAKGKTNQPLSIWVYPGWASHPAVLELAAVGHRVIPMCQPSNLYDQTPDLILHPAGGWDEALFEQFTRANGTTYRPYTEARIKWARARKRVSK
jgi:hypothetical protein